jgi:hypothetical protein
MTDQTETDQPGARIVFAVDHHLDVRESLSDLESRTGSVWFSVTLDAGATASVRSDAITYIHSRLEPAEPFFETT